MNNELFKDCKGYATRENAIKAFEKKTTHIDCANWFIVALPSGRFMPCVAIANNPELLALAHDGIAVVG